MKVYHLIIVAGICVVGAGLIFGVSNCRNMTGTAQTAAQSGGPCFFTDRREKKSNMGYSFAIIAGTDVWVSDILDGKRSFSPKTWEELRARVAHFMRLDRMSKDFEKKKLKKPIVIWR